ncbi:MAG: tetratricopeptide repeat protein [Chloroflexota bacterium]
MNRPKLRELLKKIAIRNRTDLKAIVETMPEVAERQDIGDFDFDYRIFKEQFLKTKGTQAQKAHNSTIIYVLIHALAGENPFELCHPFDALMICEWSGAGMSAFKKLSSLYGTDAIQDASNFFMMQDSDFNYLDDETFDSIYHRYTNDDPLFLDNQVTYSGEAKTQSYFLRLPHPYLDFEQAIRSRAITIRDVEALDITRELEHIKRLINEGYQIEAEDRIYTIRETAEAVSYYRIELLQLLSLVRHHQARFTEAQDYLNEAYSNANDSQKAPILGNLGLNAIYLDNFHEAKNYFEQGLELARDDIVKIYMYSSLGNLAHAKRHFTEAQQAYTLAMNNAKPIYAKERLAFLYLNMGGLYFDQKQYDFAEINYINAQQIINKMNNPHLYIQLWWNVGLLTANRGQSSYAIAQLNEISHFATQMLLPSQSLGIQLDKAKLILVRSEFPLAYDLFNQLFAKAVQINIDDYIERAFYGVILSIVQRYSHIDNMYELAKVIQKHISIEQKQFLSQDLQPAISNKCAIYFIRGAGVRLDIPFGLVNRTLQHLSKRL